MSLIPAQQHPAFIRQLLKIHYRAYLHHVAELLARMGYEDITFTNRTSLRGRRSESGFDLVVRRRVPEGKRLVLVQVKQYVPGRKLARHFVHELKGACLEYGAAE